jgi:hypothetical protein
LGGILDEIYTDEVEGKGPALEGEIGADSAEAIAADAGEIAAEEVPMISEPAPEVSVALARPYIEAAPDMASNTLGMLLFLPLLIVIYTVVVAVSGEKEVMPSILTGIQGFIWYIMGGAAVVSLLVAGVAFMAGGNGTAMVKKPKKPKAKKAPKAPKAEKEKKPKKEKPSKKPKEPKEPPKANIMEKSDKKFLTAILLCLFLGVLGAHRFYAGKTETGILQLCTFGGLGVWVLIDLIMLVMGKFTDKQGLPIKS